MAAAILCWRLRPAATSLTEFSPSPTGPSRLSIYAVLLVLVGLAGNWVYKRFFYKRPLSKGVRPGCSQRRPSPRERC